MKIPSASSIDLSAEIKIFHIQIYFLMLFQNHSLQNDFANCSGRSANHIRTICKFAKSFCRECVKCQFIGILHFSVDSSKECGNYFSQSRSRRLFINILICFSQYIFTDFSGRCQLNFIQENLFFGNFKPSQFFFAQGDNIFF